MEPVTQEMSQTYLGLALHQAETAIHTGRVIITELVREEPVDEAALAAERAALEAARLERNELRRKLEAAKAGNLARMVW